MQARYKDLFNTIIIPVMIITDIFLIASYWDINNHQTHLGVFAVIFLVVFNLAQCLVKEIPTPWGPIKTRSETLDVFRWCVNLSTCMYIIWCLNIDEPAVSAFFLLLLTFGAMTEVYGAKHKLVTVGIAVFCFAILFYGIYDLDLKDRVYMTSCYLGLIFILWKLERLIFGEITQSGKLIGVKNINPRYDWLLFHTELGTLRIHTILRKMLKLGKREQRMVWI